MARADVASDKIEAMLSDCEEAQHIPSQRGGPGYGKKDLDFLESLREQFDDRGSVSEAQFKWLQDLWDRI
jgi:hypothetical protein